MWGNVRRARVRETKNGAQVEVNCNIGAVHGYDAKCCTMGFMTAAWQHNAEFHGWANIGQGLDRGRVQNTLENEGDGSMVIVK